MCHSTLTVVQYSTCATVKYMFPSISMQVHYLSHSAIHLPAACCHMVGVKPAPAGETLRVQYSTVQYSTVQYSTVQYSTVQYNTVQYSTVQYSTVQYSTVPVKLLYSTCITVKLCWTVAIFATANTIPFTAHCLD